MARRVRRAEAIGGASGPGRDRIYRLRRRLLAWYDAHRRDLPWRRRPGDPWAQLVAEFMLQQTQVATVGRYYERFLRRFPTAVALARASQEAVLALWSGLGYYRRARMLHEAARRIVRDHGGRVPSTVEDLVRLPGIGRYTAGAIASIAFGRRAPVLDGNVRRVLIRWQAWRGDPADSLMQGRLWALAEASVPRVRPGDFNQALMELGATVCTPRRPACGHCPLNRSCLARRHGLAQTLPQTRRRRAVGSLDVVVLGIERDGRRLFEQRPAGGLWGGLWDLPSEAMSPDERPEEALARLMRRIAGDRPSAAAAEAREVGRISRSLTHRRVTFHLYRLVGAFPMPIRPLSGGFAAEDRPAGRFRWLRRGELARVGLSRATRSLLALLDVQPTGGTAARAESRRGR